MVGPPEILGNGNFVAQTECQKNGFKRKADNDWGG